MTLDLSILPPPRRRKVEERYWREAAAVRVKAVYAAMLQRHVKEVAMEETARAVRAEREAFAFVTARWVRAVVYEGR